MEVFFRNQGNITTFILLFFIFFIGYRKLDHKDALNRSFLLTTIGVMIGLFAESATDMLNGYSSGLAITFNKLFSVILFIVAPMIAFSFLLFIFNLIFQKKHLKKNLWLILIVPIVSNVVISLLSPFYGLFFYINNLGVYSRGPLWMLSALSTYVYLLLGLMLVLLNKRYMLTQDFWLILGIGTVPILGGIVQSLVYGIMTMWSSAGAALIIAYLFLQERMVRLDSLTGAWNRESFFNVYTRRIQQSPNKTFGAIYFDIDNLKQINDTYGHLEGDNAIILVMKVIDESIKSGYTMCRLGGDEFILLHDCETETEIFDMLDTIKEAFKTHAEMKQKPYLLACSFSAALYTSGYSSLNALLSKLDYLMYQEKYGKRESK